MNEFGKTPGLEWFKLYSGVVVENDDSKSEDGRKLCRIKVRVPVIFDGIEDDHLPWCIPFTDYSKGEHADWGHTGVPPIDSKVCIAFQGGSLYHPVYTSHHVDEQVTLEEMNENYPFRTVHLLPNKFLAIVDTKTNEVFLRNPGRMSIYIMGDAEIIVKGNMTEKIMGNRTTYVEGDSIDHVVGNRTTYTEGSELQMVDGSQRINVEGGSLQVVADNLAVHVGASHLLEVGNDSMHTTGGDNIEVYSGSSGKWVGGNSGDYAAGMQILVGSTIHENPPSGFPNSPQAPRAPSAPQKPTKPVILEWNGVRWDQPKDTN